MPFRRGRSGNPRGRPPKSRALTDILEGAGRAKFANAAGEFVEPRRVVAEMLWSVLTTGETLLPNGESLTFSSKDWLEAAKFVYSQVDGPVKPQMPTEGENAKPRGKAPLLEDLDGADEHELTQLYREAAGEA